MPEIQAIAWLTHYSWAGFWNWGAQALDPAPLASLIQLPFVLLFGASRLGPRIPALLFALGACVFFLQAAQRAVPKGRYPALLLFVLLPAELLAVTEPTQYEAGVFFVLVATIALVDLAAQPKYRSGAVFALATAACLFTDHHAALAVFGAVLFLLRFSAGPQQRKAVWFALGSCAAAAIAYVPYYVWVRSHTNGSWLSEPGLTLNTFRNMTVTEWALAISVLIIIAGAITGGVISFRIPPQQLTRRLTLFCLCGSVVVTVAFILAVSLYTLSPLPTRDLLYGSPAAVLLFAAALDWLVQAVLFRAVRVALGALAVAALIVCAFADVQFVTGPQDNLALESRYVAPELTGNSCVVFVSEQFSKPLFLVFQPDLDSRECEEFFHHRIVLASHPFVRSDQQADAESFFRGLNFHQVKRIRSGGGQIVVFEGK